MTPAEFAALLALTPEEALSYMEGRGEVTESYDWRDVWEDEHALQFTVSRMARLDLLVMMQQALEAAVAGDLSRTDWMAGMEAALKAAGWWGTLEVIDPATGETVNTTFNEDRLKLIFDMNVRMANAAGRWERIERARKTHPYLRYITKGDERVRAAHQAWHNVTLPIDHPFWKTRYPPNGWRCRCRAMAVNRRQYEAGKAPDGSPLITDAPDTPMREWINKRTGEIIELPEGVDPGFAYNVGEAGQRAQELKQLAEEKLDKAPQDIADAAREDGM